MIDPTVLVRRRHTPIIRGENENGIISQSQIFELFPYSTQAFVCGLQHSGKLNIILLLLDPPDTGILMILQFIVFR